MLGLSEHTVKMHLTDIFVPERPLRDSSIVPREHPPSPPPSCYLVKVLVPKLRFGKHQSKRKRHARVQQLCIVSSSVSLSPFHIVETCGPLWSHIHSSTNLTQGRKQVPHTDTHTHICCLAHANRQTLKATYSRHIPAHTTLHKLDSCLAFLLVEVNPKLKNAISSLDVWRIQTSRPLFPEETTW